MRRNTRSLSVKHLETLEEAIEEGVLSVEAAANLFLYRDFLTGFGKSYGDYCREHGIVGPAQERRIKRHERRMIDS